MSGAERNNMTLNAHTFDNMADAMAAAGAKKPRKFSKAPYSLLEEEASRLTTTPAKVADEYGYTSSSASAWSQKGEIPKVLAQAIKYRRRAEKAPAQGKAVLLSGVLKNGIGEEQAKIVLSTIFERCKLMDLPRP